MKKKDNPLFTLSLDNTLISPVRLPIITLLVLYDEVDFTFIKKELDLSDGNLGASLRKLEDDGLILSKKMFVGRKPKTIYRISSKGLKQLKQFIASMKNIEKACR